MINISLIVATIALIGAAGAIGVFLYRPSTIKNNASALKITSRIYIGLSAAVLIQTAISHWIPPTNERVLTVEPANTPAAPVETRVFAIDETLTANDDLWNNSTRDYIRRFQATPGYQIVAGEFRAKTSEHANDIRFEINEANNEGLLLFRLTSDSKDSKYIGHLTGDLIITEKAAPNPSVNTDAAR